jgi:hypothetical protein
MDADGTGPRAEYWARSMGGGLGMWRLDPLADGTQKLRT